MSWRIAPLIAVCSVRKTTRRREDVETVVAEHVRLERTRAEHGRKGVIAHAQSARIGAEGRHHQHLAVAGKTTPADGAAALHDARDRVQMAGDFARWRVSRGLVAELERT